MDSTTLPDGSFPLKSCFETQHLRSVLQMPSTLRIASQKPDNFSATQTPGHVSGFGGKINLYFELNIVQSFGGWVDKVC